MSVNMCSMTIDIFVGYGGRESGVWVNKETA